MAQTAIEMLAECLRLRHKDAYNDLYEDIETYYKKIEKEQILNAFDEGSSDGYDGWGSTNKEKYYNETYRNKKRYDEMSDKEIEEWGIENN